MIAVASQSKGNRNPLRLLLWFSWACAGYFAFAWIGLGWYVGLPGVMQFASLLSGAVVAFGSALALTFLVVAARKRATTLSGIAALATNVLLLAFFVLSLS